MKVNAAFLVRKKINSHTGLRLHKKSRITKYVELFTANFEQIPKDTIRRKTKL